MRERLQNRSWDQVFCSRFCQPHYWLASSRAKFRFRPASFNFVKRKAKNSSSAKINFLFRMCQPKFTNEFVRQNIIILLLLCIVSSWRLSDIVNGPIDDDDDMSFFTIWCLLPAAEWNPIWKEDDSFFDQSAFTVHAV
jgi:hypothetical protein